MILPAITLYEPYGSLVRVGAKTAETRSWKPHPRHIGKRIAIHAGKTLEPGLDAYPEVCRQMEKSLGIPFARWRTQLPFGKMLCIATLTGAYQSRGHVQGEEFVSLGASVPGSPPLGGIHMGYPGILFGDHSKDRWIWRLVVHEVLTPPIPVRGERGIWMWEHAEAAA